MRPLARDPPLPCGLRSGAPEKRPGGSVNLLNELVDAGRAVRHLTSRRCRNAPDNAVIREAGIVLAGRGSRPPKCGAAHTARSRGGVSQVTSPVMSQVTCQVASGVASHSSRVFRGGVVRFPRMTGLRTGGELRRAALRSATPQLPFASRRVTYDPAMEPATIAARLASSAVTPIVKKLFVREAPGAGLVDRPVRISSLVSFKGEQRTLTERDLSKSGRGVSRPGGSGGRPARGARRGDPTRAGRRRHRSAAQHGRPRHGRRTGSAARPEGLARQLARPERPVGRRRGVLRTSHTHGLPAHPQLLQPALHVHPAHPRRTDAAARPHHHHTRPAPRTCPFPVSARTPASSSSTPSTSPASTAN